jgi:hypothetical protein
MGGTLFAKRSTGWLDEPHRYRKIQTHNVDTISQVRTVNIPQDKHLHSRAERWLVTPSLIEVYL